MDARTIARWVVLPLVAGALLAGSIDPWAPPIVGRERISAVLLLDGQAYFGHVTDVPWSESIEIRDVYYFRDARATSTGLPLGLQRRGTELHQPTGSMTIRRDKIIAIEDLQPGSPVIAAIATERSLTPVPRP